MTNPAEPAQAKPSKPRALTYTEMMNGGRQQMDEAEHVREQQLQQGLMPCSATLISWSRPWGLSAEYPLSEGCAEMNNRQR